jgi:Ni,Fe-hydrogenase III small subunit
MAQTTYSRYPGGASPGTPGDSNFGQKASFLNDEGAAIPVGIGVAYKSEGKAELFDLGTDELAGIVMNDFARVPDGLTGDNGIQAGAMMTVLEEGTAYVHCEQSVTPADPVYCRHTSDGGSNTVLGKFRKDSDSGRARLVKGARFVSAGSSSTAPAMHFSRSAEKAAQKLDADQLKITLTAAAEAGNAIVVSGAVTDSAGNAVIAAKQVMVRSLAVTADQGDISVTSGTSKKIVNPTTGENVAWIQTTAAGLFAVSIANTAAEETLVQAFTEDGISALLKLTFA